MIEGMTLKGRAVGMFGSVSNFADKLGWSYSRTYRLLTGRQNMTLPEFAEIISALNITDAEEVKRLVFFLLGCTQ